METSPKPLFLFFIPFLAPRVCKLKGKNSLEGVVCLFFYICLSK